MILTHYVGHDPNKTLKWILKKDKNRQSIIWKIIESNQLHVMERLLALDLIQCNVFDGTDYIHNVCTSIEMHRLLSSYGHLHGLWDECISRMSPLLLSMYLEYSPTETTIAEFLEDFDARFDRMHYMKLKMILEFISIISAYGKTAGFNMKMQLVGALKVARQRHYPNEITLLLNEINLDII